VVEEPVGRRPVDPANVGRRGTRWRNFRQDVFAAYGTSCWICGHGGAYEVDHVNRLADGGDPYDLETARPAHGSNYPCPVCISTTTGRARCCNQERNRKAAPSGQVALSVDLGSI
jgi:hypothetical protein